MILVRIFALLILKCFNFPFFHPCQVSYFSRGLRRLMVIDQDLEESALDPKRNGQCRVAPVDRLKKSGGKPTGRLVIVLSRHCYDFTGKLLAASPSCLPYRLSLTVPRLVMKSKCGASFTVLQDRLFWLSSRLYVIIHWHREIWQATPNSVCNRVSSE